MGLFAGLARTSIKLGAVAAAVFISVENNVWSLNTTEGENTYEKLKKNIVPGSIVFKEKISPKDEIVVDAGEKWNDNVKCAFKFINDVPEIVNNQLNSFYKPTETAK